MRGGLLHSLVLVALVMPAILLATLSIPSVLGRPLRETIVGLLTRVTLLTTFSATMLALIAYLASGSTPQVVWYGAWFSSGEVGIRFDFLVDGWSLGFAALSAAICGVVAAFSNRYLHREPGYNRYFVLFAMFLVGILLVALAGSIEVLIAGWELLGLSSALLVGFFHERTAPVANAFRVMSTYRVGDAALVSAAVLLHHWTGSGNLSLLFWGYGGIAPVLPTAQATVIAILLIAAVAAKSALLPCSGWLPRAMEGPTPSSAVYYGALSVHAGCYLLLRAAPLLDQSPAARVFVGILGAATALYATVIARVQTDVKGALSYASLTQVGVIVVEIALGLNRLAFVHILGHACFRTLQFLSAPNILHDLHDLENAIGERRESTETRQASVGDSGHRGLYLIALERGFVDSLLDRLVVEPLTRLAASLDRLDRTLCGFGDGRRRSAIPGHDD